MLAQLVKAVKRLAADVAYKRVKVWIIVVQSWLSLVHAGYVALLNKAVTWSVFVIDDTCARIVPLTGHISSRRCDLDYKPSSFYNIYTLGLFSPAIDVYAMSRRSSAKYNSKTIRDALGKLESTLGGGNVQALIYTLEFSGISLSNDSNEYSFSQIRSAIEEIFGVGAPLMLKPFEETLCELAV